MYGKPWNSIDDFEVTRKKAREEVEREAGNILRSGQQDRGLTPPLEPIFARRDLFVPSPRSAP